MRMTKEEAITMSREKWAISEEFRRGWLDLQADTVTDYFSQSKDYQDGVQCALASSSGAVGMGTI